MKSYDQCKAIVELDLDPIKVKLMHQESGEGWTLQQASAVEAEYRRFLFLMKTFPTELAAPNMDVDTFWHYHILDTMKYAQDCQEIFGHFLHHFPYVGLRGEDDLAAHHRLGERMRELYEDTFGEPYPGNPASVPESMASSARTAYSAIGARTAYSATGARTAYSATGARTAYSATGARTAYSATGARTAYSATGARTAYFATGARSGISATAYSATGARSAYSATGMRSAYSASGVGAEYAGDGVELSMDGARASAGPAVQHSGIAVTSFFSIRPRLQQAA